MWGLIFAAIMAGVMYALLRWALPFLVAVLMWSELRHNPYEPLLEEFRKRKE